MIQRQLSFLPESGPESELALQFQILEPGSNDASGSLGLMLVPERSS